MIKKIRTTPALIIMQLILIMIFFDVFGMILISLKDFSPAIFSLSREMSIYLLLAILEISISFFAIFKWLYDFFTIKDGILIHRQGIFFPVIREYSLHKIENITYSRGFLGTIFDYGKVSIHFADECFTFRRIPDPEYFVDMLHRDYTESHEENIEIITIKVLYTYTKEKILYC